MKSVRPKQDIKPLTGGTTYTATSFDAALMLDSSGTIGQIRIRFYDATGKVLPHNAISPLPNVSYPETQNALQAIMLVSANAGETLPQLLTRAAIPYVQLVYGVQV